LHICKTFIFSFGENIAIPRIPRVLENLEIKLRISMNSRSLNILKTVEEFCKKELYIFWKLSEDPPKSTDSQKNSEEDRRNSERVLMI